MMQYKKQIEELLEWLRNEALRQIEGCRRLSHDGGTWCYTPDGEGHYGAQWTRDFCYVVEGFGDAVSNEDLYNSVVYLIGGVREDGTAPDRVQMDGVPVYSAGPPEHPLGEPPTDNAQYLVKLVYLAVKRTGNPEIFLKHAPVLERVMECLPRRSDGLVFIDPQGPSRSPYGFTDCVGKTGGELFTSLLFWEASNCMSELYETIGNQDDALRWKAEATRVQNALAELWDEATGTFFAATHDCRQLDVWGSAYAVFIGAVSKEQSFRISKWLDEHYDEIVWEGLVRHLPEPLTWEKMLTEIGPGTYQNGGYWPVPTSWVINALRMTNPEKASKTLVDLITHMQRMGVNEWETKDGTVGVPDYVASATLPLIAVREELGG